MRDGLPDSFTRSTSLLWTSTAALIAAAALQFVLADTFHALHAEPAVHSKPLDETSPES